MTPPTRVFLDKNVFIIGAAYENAVEAKIPREDITVYLAARNGQAQCFISSNHGLIRALCQETGEFECMTPQEFANKYLSSPKE